MMKDWSLLAFLQKIKAVFSVKPTSKEGQFRLFKNDITQASYFNYADHPEEIETWDEIVLEGLTSNNWLVYPNQNWINDRKSNDFDLGNDKLFDYRTIVLDSDYMFRGVPG